MAEKTDKTSVTKNQRVNESSKNKSTRSSTKLDFNDITMINAILSSQQNRDYQIQQLEQEADFEAQQIQLNECLKYVAQLVDFFKHTVIMYELERDNDWHENVRHQLKTNKGSTGNKFIDHKVEKIAIIKGLTKEQWTRLLYLTLTTDDNTDLTKISKKYLNRVRDMASRLLESDQQMDVLALVNVIEKHMPQKYYSGR